MEMIKNKINIFDEKGDGLMIWKCFVVNNIWAGGEIEIRGGFKVFWENDGKFCEFLPLDNVRTIQV